MALYHFVGIGGSGMSALAQLLAAMGNQVTGSDRNLDLGVHLPIFDLLSSQGIKLFPQNGSGVTPETDILVISTAIEENVPDVIKARTLPIPISKRADLLAHLFNDRKGIAVAGTSGKSTVTGMIGHILFQAGQDPVIVNGGMMKNFPLNNCPNNIYVGSSNIMVIEGDESDGSIIKYRPALSIISSISKDHKTIPQLLSLFKTFADQTKEKVIANADCPHICSLDLHPSRTVTYSLEKD
ncbi:MAG: UDP-N-acetylmuramate--alanine ligase, partial [Deltaproteobacteria bacterium]|nr:UDP-N-acetylmuramate--alanine ligase [Deltaproteobacteria bacterium]